MAWGLIETDSFGDFLQRGEYVGWEDAALKYLSTEASEAERLELNARPGGYSLSDLARKFSGNYGPVSPQLCPVEIKLEKRANTLGSLVQLTSRLLAVDAELKVLIEELEPAVHQFWPLRIVQPKGEPYPKAYFGMRIGRFLDSFVPEQSDPAVFLEQVSIAGGTHISALDHSKKGYAKLALRPATIGDAHLWREAKLRNPKIFISDTLQSEIAARGLRVVKHYQLKSV